MRCVDNLDQGSSSGEGDLSISHLPCRLQGLCGSGKARMRPFFLMKIIYRDMTVFFLYFSFPALDNRIEKKRILFWEPDVMPGWLLSCQSS